MASAALLSIEPIARGGVPMLVAVVDALLRKVGHQPLVLYSDADAVPVKRSALLGYYWRHWRPYRTTKQPGSGGNLDCLAVPRYPGSYVSTLQHAWWFARRALQADIRIALTGGAQTGLPFTFDSYPFIVWVATLYADELHARSIAGDQWATQFLQSAEWQQVQAAETRVLTQASRVLALSPYTAQRLLATHPSLAARLETVFYPIDTSFFYPAVTPNPDTPYLLLTARTQDPRKNVRLLLQAFAALRQNHPLLRLVITGDESSPALLSLLSELNITDQVQFVGQQTTADLRRLYQNATLFVLPSNQEGLAISVLEAMACGVAVVSTRCGGPEALIEASSGGLLTPLGDVAAFTAACQTLLADPAQRMRRATAGAAYIRQHCSLPVIEAQLLTIFKQVYPQFFN